jgi:hypothetical protein
MTFQERWEIPSNMKHNELVNKDYGEMLTTHLLEQYKLFVNASLDVTSKRLEANKFHLTLNSIVFGFASYLTTLDQNAVIVLLSFVGILSSIVWLKNLFAYKELNKAKFMVIHELEKHLPACLFKYEEACYLKKYYGLTSTEKYYPIIFIILYLGLIAFTIWSAGWFSLQF